MDLAPVELVAFQFPGNQFNGDVAPALGELVEQGTIRIIDLIFVMKDDAGETVGVELSDLDDDLRGAYEPWVDEVTGLVSDEDMEDLMESIADDSAALILVFEHLWAERFAHAVRDSGGQLASTYRIPREAIEQAMALRSAD